MDIGLTALVRAGLARALPGALEMSDDRDLFTVNGAGAQYTEITRGGEVWNAISAAGTPLVVIPTTLCIAEYFNNTTDRVMEVMDLFLFHLLGTAALHNLSLWAEVTPKKAAPSVATSITIGSQSGKVPYTAIAGSDVVPAAGTTVIANGWRPWGMPGPGVVSTALPVPCERMMPGPCQVPDTPCGVNDPSIRIATSVKNTDDEEGAVML